MSNFALRTLTALIGGPLVLGAMWLGGWAFGCLVALAAALAQVELYGMARAAGLKPFVVLGVALGAIACVAALVGAAVVPLLLVGAVALVLAPLLRAPEDRSGAALLDAAATGWGVVYPAALAGAFVMLREAPLPGDDAFWLTATVLVSVWVSDTCAYLVGRAVGKTPLFPRVSPNKTWEGAIGGVVGALGWVALARVLVLADTLSWIDVAAIGLCCGVASQLGDLAESLFKRSVGVKDSGTLLPGHGGLLDRIDAAVVAAPLVAAYVALAW